MKAYYNKDDEWMSSASLLTALDLEEQHPKVIAAVGAGGKTSTMYQLAREFAAGGKRTAIVTTTHMELPPPDMFFTQNASEAAAQLDRQGFVIAGVQINEKNFASLPTEGYRLLLDATDVLLVEADGSKRMPLKIPASHEPVIPAEAEFVIVIAGLSSLGKRIDETCHRAELVKMMLGKEGDHSISPEDIAVLLRRGYWEPFVAAKNLAGSVLLNQADDLEKTGQGKQICHALGKIPCVLTKYE